MRLNSERKRHPDVARRGARLAINTSNLAKTACFTAGFAGDSHNLLAVPRLDPIAIFGASLIFEVSFGTMDINALVISGSDPGAVPGGSTNHPSLEGYGAETGSTNV
jgi:hypothetical protein